MSWSLVEIRALALKAARGAGLSWGLAEEAGFAVRWLQARELPGVQALALYLEQCEKHGLDASKCPLQIGAGVSDGASPEDSELGEVRTPLLLIPFIAQSLAVTSCRLQCENLDFTIAEDGCMTSNPDEQLLVTEAKCKLVSGGEIVPPMSRASRVPESEAVHVSTLAKFAHRTYAPATEESRLAGAGAGLSDND